jgi:hypothetical protein
LGPPVSAALKKKAHLASTKRKKGQGIEPPAEGNIGQSSSLLPSSTKKRRVRVNNKNKNGLEVVQITPEQQKSTQGQN